MKKKLLGVLGIVSVAFVAATGMFYQKASADVDDQRIYPGVYLDGVDVGGLTKEEAVKEYDHFINGIENLKLTFTSINGSYSTTLGEIGVKITAEDAVEQAYNYGRQGNILTRYKEIKELEKNSVVVVPTKKFDQKLLEEKLETDAESITAEPKNASITREDGEFVIHEGVVGTTIKTEDTIKAVEEIFESEWKQRDIQLEAVVEEQQPKYSVEQFEAIDSVLGQAVTSYRQDNEPRCKNLATGASKISGTVLMPGEQFSVYNTVAPFTEENGYANAGMYVSNENGDIETVDGYGGGICQVSTTLYNAVLKAELQVDERYPHSLTVSYVDHSKDAAIAGDYMDFKFTNSLDYPIYIEGYAGGGSISFAVYGHETRPSNRTIEFVSKTIETYDPEDPEEIKDDTLEEGTTVTESSAHTGYYAELWKNIYIDGVLTDSVRVNQSKYSAQRGKIRVGTKKKEEDKDKDKDKDKKKDKKKDDAENQQVDPPEEEETTTQPEEPTTEAPTEAPAEENSGDDSAEGE